MQRRNFLKNTIVTSTGIIFLPVLAKAGLHGEKGSKALSELERNFMNPPDAARPWVFYMWMNGNITHEGITADLEAMKRMGIGGAICFNSAVGIPRGPVDYAGDAWMKATAHAVKEADRLGLELSIHNSPGYSGCGGPWVTPEMSMQELAWTEALVQSKGTIDIHLQQPYARLNYYKDAFVIAYPSLPVEKAMMKDKLAKIFINGKKGDKNVLTDGNPETKIRIEPSTDQQAVLLLEFAEPFEARAISITRKPELPVDLFDGARDRQPVFRLESSDDNIHFTSVGSIRCPELKAMDTPAALSFAPVVSRFYRLVANSATWVSDVQLYNGPRLGGWPGKTNYSHGGFNGETPAMSQELLIDPSTVVDISAKMNSDGNLQWNAPAGNWTILRIGHTTTGEENAAHPDAGAGLEIDKLRREAIDLHFASFLDKLINQLKPYAGKAFKGITVDSWEAGKQNWTIGFPAIFRQRKNYDITAWMPAMTGRIVGSIDDTEHFLWDVRKTHADVLSENFYGYFQQLCHDRGLDFHAEPYGDGTFDSLQVAQHLDITMSEFWTRYIYGSDTTSKQAASAAHVYGKKVVAAESFTAMPATSKWTDYPYSLKAEGDYFFTLGVNRLVFHTFVHQPYMTGKPGMTMGPFGTHFDRNNSWAEQTFGWTYYLKRTQYLLQQGLTVADLCYFKGDDPESGVPDIYTFLPQGYSGDVIGADVLHNRFRIDNRSILLPDGMQYRLCMMAPLTHILPTTLQKLKELVADGMVLLVNNKPSGSYGHSFKDKEVVTITNELYGPLDGKTVTEHNYGKGKVIWGRPLQQVFAELALSPDFAYTAENQDAAIHYIHKVIGDIEFYFVSNHRRRKENIVCSFRTSGKRPEIWNSESGARYGVALYETVDRRTNMPLELEPAGALFILFRKAVTGDGYATVIKDGKEFITTKPFKAAEPGLYADVQDNFTVSLWAKPDTFAHNGKSMLFHPPEGEVVYGTGHAAFGLSAGQNMIRIYERVKGPAREVLTYQHPVEGWTHIAVAYDSGKPTLFVNGKSVATHAGSGNKIHPGLGTPASEDQFSSYFEGNHTMPQLFKKVLNEDEISRQYAVGLPQPELPMGIVLQKDDNKLKALIWQNGHYQVRRNKEQKSFGEIKACKNISVEGLWKIRFPEKSGAPKEIILTALMSLHKHEDFNVKHFSGTVTYLKTISIANEDLQTGKKLFLYLGRVEVIAEVKLNGQQAGIIWKEPFMVDITGLAKNGDNELEIRVTNLWPNRLIGDEYLPKENEYSVDNYIERLPDWYVRNQPKPGGRVAFSVWHSYDKDSPLLESGLLGPVKLLTAIEKTI